MGADFKEAICDVNLEIKKPLTESDCHEWENTNKLVLPSDLKDFYQTTNGFNFSWNNVCGGEIFFRFSYGIIEVNAKHLLSQILLPFDVSDDIKFWSNSCHILGKTRMLIRIQLI